MTKLSHKTRNCQMKLILAEHPRCRMSSLDQTLQYYVQPLFLQFNSWVNFISDLKKACMECLQRRFHSYMYIYPAFLWGICRNASPYLSLFEWSSVNNMDWTQYCVLSHQKLIYGQQTVFFSFQIWKALTFWLICHT